MIKFAQIYKIRIVSNPGRAGEKVLLMMLRPLDRYSVRIRQQMDGNISLNLSNTLYMLTLKNHLPEIPKMKLIICFITSLWYISTGFSQETLEPVVSGHTPVKQYKHSIKAGAGLPLIISNVPFRNAMDGIYSVHCAADFRLHRPVVAGLYYNYAMFDNADLKGNKGRRTDVTKGLFSSAGISLGYEKFISENKVVSVTGNSGYGWIDYRRSVSMTDTVSNLYKTEALIFGLTAGYSIVIEETGGIGFYLSYRYVNDSFDPAKVLLIGEGSVQKTQFLTLGVIFTYGY